MNLSAEYLYIVFVFLLIWGSTFNLKPHISRLVLSMLWFQTSADILVIFYRPNLIGPFFTPPMVLFALEYWILLCHLIILYNLFVVDESWPPTSASKTNTSLFSKSSNTLVSICHIQCIVVNKSKIKMKKEQTQNT